MYRSEATESGGNTWLLRQIFVLVQLVCCTFSVSFCVAAGATGSPAPAAGEISVLHIEVTQGIQDDKQSVPLLKGKRTFVRVFFNYSGAALVPTWSGLLGLSDPATGVQNEIHSLNSASSRLDPALSGKLDVQRHSVSSGLLFELPITLENWTTKSRIVFSHLKLMDSSGHEWNICTNCADLANDANFHPSQKLKINLIGLRYQRNGEQFQPREVDLTYVKSYLARAYPAGEVDVETRIFDWTPNPFGPANEPSRPVSFNCNAANAALTQLRASDIDGGEDPLTHYYGLVFDGSLKATDFSQFMRGCASVPATPDPTAVGSGAAGTNIPPVWTSKSQAPTYADWYAAHEIGHTFGRPHVGTTCGDTPNDNNFPFTHDTGPIADQARRFFVFDPGEGNLSLPMIVTAGEQRSDTMSYCDNEWPSFYTYIMICRNLNAEAGKACAAFAPDVADSTISNLPSSAGAVASIASGTTSPKTASGDIAEAIEGVPAKEGQAIPIEVAQATPDRQSSRAAPDAGAAGVDKARGDSVAGNNAPNSSAIPSGPHAIASGSLVTLTAKLNFAKNAAEITAIDPVSKATSPPQPASGAPSPNDVRVNLYGPSADILQSFSGKVYFDTDQPPGAEPTGLFVATFPYNPAVDRLSIVRNGKELASASAGSAGFTLSKPQPLAPEPPAAGVPDSSFATALEAHRSQVQSGIGHFDNTQGKIIYSWDNDSPEKNVNYNVQLSLDDGKWKTVALNLKTPRLVLDPTWISGGKKAVLRVIGKSGIHSQIVTSDVLMLDLTSGLIK
jgi:hypothetical protein